MAGKRQAGQRREAGRFVSLLTWGSFSLSMAFASGCTQTPTTAQQNLDPLHGARTPPGTPGPNPHVAPAPQANNNGGGLPPIPTALSASNTATIAGTSWQTSGSGTLAINDKSSVRLGAPGQLTNDTKTTPINPGLPANSGPKVIPVPDAKPPTQVVTPAGSWQQQATPLVQTTNSAPDPSEAVLAKQLQDRGVVNQKREAVPEGVHLTCFVANQDGVHLYEVTAANYTTAATKILQQIP